MKTCNEQSNLNTETKIGLSIIQLNQNKIPKKEWKQFQTAESNIHDWFNHFMHEGLVGILTGKISGNLEGIDIDSKNDPTNRIIEDYRALIPNELYEKLLVVITPSGGRHYLYRCKGAVIQGNRVLASHTDNETIIETRGEGGYICQHISEYPIEQGEFDLSRLKFNIPEITVAEREFLLETAESLNRHIKFQAKPFVSKNKSINDFNSDFDIISLFEKHNWTVVEETAEKIFLLRDGSTAHHSGSYLKESKLFFCFSSSTKFNVKVPYNHYQVLQTLEGLTDYKATLRMIVDLGFKSDNNDEKRKTVSSQEIADYLKKYGVTYNTFIQEVTINGKVIEEIDNNTLFIDLNKHFDTNVARSKFEDVMKSHLIVKEDPIRSFIEKHKDVKPSGAIAKWVDCLTLKNANITKEQIVYFVLKWYVGLIAQCLDGEYPNEFFLAILSTKQGVGKTTLLRKYTIPEELQAYRKEVSISDSDDFKVIMSQALLIIDDEMDGRTLNEDKTFKAILSKKELPIRRKYDRRITNLVRRCSFAGCGNQVNVVRERQNRRIIPIEVSAIDHKKAAELNQIEMFMEAYNLFVSGFRYSFEGSDAEKINQLAGDYFSKSDLDEIIDESILNPKTDYDIKAVSAIQLINALNYKYPTLTKKINTFSIGKILADRGIETKRVGANKTTNYLLSKSSSILTVIDDLKNASSHVEIGFEKEK